MTITAEELRETIRRELPAMAREDPALREWLLALARGEFAPKQETESRFDRVLDELRRDREKNEARWQATQEELRRDREEQSRKWEEQSRQWDEANRHFDRIHEEIMAQARKHDSAIGALGARWGINSESAFRQGLEAILAGSFGVQVLNVTEYDDEGEVFGRPDQVELDVIVKNGTLILCELKSSLSKGDLYLFERKARFYERRHQRKADRLLAISPMIDPRAKGVAERLGIESYGYAEDVPV